MGLLMLNCVLKTRPLGTKLNCVSRHTCTYSCAEFDPVTRFKVGCLDCRRVVPSLILPQHCIGGQGVTSLVSSRVDGSHVSLSRSQQQIESSSAWLSCSSPPQVTSCCPRPQSSPSSPWLPVQTSRATAELRSLSWPCRSCCRRQSPQVNTAEEILECVLVHKLKQKEVMIVRIVARKFGSNACFELHKLYGTVRAWVLTLLSPRQKSPGSG